MSIEEQPERITMNHNYATHQDIQVLENKFSHALADGFNKLEQAINSRTDKIENRISAIDHQRSKEINELREKQSSSGKFNPVLTVSIISLVWVILFGIMAAFGAVTLRSVVNETKLDNMALISDHQDGLIREIESDISNIASNRNTKEEGAQRDSLLQNLSERMIILEQKSPPKNLNGRTPQ